MKVISKILRIKPMEIEIIRPTLLSIEEYEECKDNISLVPANWWWLRSPGLYSDSVACVDDYGDMRESGSNVDDECGVRPVLIIDIRKSDLNIGDSFKFKKNWFTIIDFDMAICDNFIINNLSFDDNDNNNFETSAIKKYLDEWFNSKN